MEVIRKLTRRIFPALVPTSTVDNIMPKTVEDFGYTFNSEGCLCKIDDSGHPTSEKYEFNISTDPAECQKRYEELGDAITEYIYQRMEKDEELVRLPVPVEDADGATFIFASRDYDTNDKLVLLIHGSGAVRAGQWAQSVIINDNLYLGSQLPYIRRARELGYAVLVLNGNDNWRLVNAKRKRIDKTGTSDDHAAYVWDKYVSPAAAHSIGIVAHSYGGINTLHVADRHRTDFERRVRAVAMTDSVHGASHVAVTEHLRKVGRNWVTSAEPLDTPLKTRDNDVPEVSAGTRVHELTSHCAFESVIKYISERL